MEVLRQADPSFERNEEDKASATNESGFAIDFLRREEEERYSDAFPISGTEGDIYPVQARRADKFIGSPPFDQVVIAVDGTMTLMGTIDPKTFADFKEWMADLKDRDPLKRTRDKRQAQAVRQLLTEERLRSRL